MWLYDEVTGKTRMLPSSAAQAIIRLMQRFSLSCRHRLLLCICVSLRVFAGVSQGQMMLYSAAPDAKLLEENGDLR